MLSRVSACTLLSSSMLLYFYTIMSSSCLTLPKKFSEQLMHQVLCSTCQQQRLFIPSCHFPYKTPHMSPHCVAKNIYAQKYPLSSTSFESIPTGHLQILMHLSICLTCFLTLIACAFLLDWLPATAIIHLVPREQDLWNRNISLVTEVTSH